MSHLGTKVGFVCLKPWRRLGVFYAHVSSGVTETHCLCSIYLDLSLYITPTGLGPRRTNANIKLTLPTLLWVIDYINKFGPVVFLPAGPLWQTNPTASITWLLDSTVFWVSAHQLFDNWVNEWMKSGCSMVNGLKKKKTWIRKIDRLFQLFRQ